MSTEQSIELTVEMGPADFPQAIAAVYPWMSIRMPEVDEVLRAMISSDSSLLEGISHGTLRQPIDIVSGAQGRARWFVRADGELTELVWDMKSNIDKFVIPFMDEYASPSDILEFEFRQDRRVIRDRAQMLRVVAATVMVSGRLAALKVMEDLFGSPGLKKRYQAAFSYLQEN